VLNITCAGAAEGELSRGTAGSITIVGSSPNTVLNETLNTVRSITRCENTGISYFAHIF